MRKIAILLGLLLLAAVVEVAGAPKKIHVLLWSELSEPKERLSQRDQPAPWRTT